MEVSLISENALRIKGKNASLAVDPLGKVEANAVILFVSPKIKINAENAVVINGPGEYETGGIKITGARQNGDISYAMTVDSVSILLGKVSALQKMQQKLKEANILIVNCDDNTDPSYLTALVTNVIIFYGEKALEVSNSYGQENVKHLSKYSSTIDKLPAEVETVILE